MFRVFGPSPSDTRKGNACLGVLVWLIWLCSVLEW